jgi:phosphatidylglycerol:prolipoprotein diacylglycerol transferase
MLPYVALKVVEIGPFRVPIFGPLLVVAIVTGRYRILSRARSESTPDERSMAMLCLAMLVSGMFAAHVAKLEEFYGLRALLADPMVVIRESRGIRSVGGIYGGLAGGIVWCLANGFRGGRVLAMLDRIAFALPFSWMIGRLGCALIHDHPGHFSQSWLAVDFPGGARYDLGVLEFLLLVPFSVLFEVLNRRARPDGFYFGLFGVLYGGLRAWLESLQLKPTLWYPSGGLLGIAVGLAGWLAMAHYSGAELTSSAAGFHNYLRARFAGLITKEP